MSWVSDVVGWFAGKALDSITKQERCDICRDEVSTHSLNKTPCCKRLICQNCVEAAIEYRPCFDGSNNAYFVCPNCSKVMLLFYLQNPQYITEGDIESS